MKAWVTPYQYIPTPALSSRIAYCGKFYTWVRGDPGLLTILSVAGQTPTLSFRPRKLKERKILSDRRLGLAGWRNSVPFGLPYGSAFRRKAGRPSLGTVSSRHPVREGGGGNPWKGHAAGFRPLRVLGRPWVHSRAGPRGPSFHESTDLVLSRGGRSNPSGRDSLRLSRVFGVRLFQWPHRH